MLYLGLGSNIGNRTENINNALTLIATHIGRIVRASSLYETEAWGYHSAHKFLNAAVAVETTLLPEEVLQHIKAIESALGRTKTEAGAYRDRPIDIDILFYNDMIVRSAQLAIPHQHVERRQFVLAPMAEIAPGFAHPVLQKTMQELNDNVNSLTPLTPLAGQLTRFAQQLPD